MNRKAATPKAKSKTPGAKTVAASKKIPPVSVKDAPKRGRPAKATAFKLEKAAASKSALAVPALTGTAMIMIPVDSIMPSPFQTRGKETEADLAGLADSIKANGILQPLTVRQAGTDAPSGVKHELVFGHRRLAAAKLAGLKCVPCLARDMDADRAHFAHIIENLQRKDLSPIDEADGVNALTETAGQTAPQIAKMLGVSERWVFRRRKLAAIIPEWRKILLETKAGQLFCERLAACPAPLQKVLLKSTLTKDPDADQIGSTLWEAGARPIKEMPWSKKHTDWCFACPSVMDTLKTSDTDLGEVGYQLSNCQFCGDPACRAAKEKSWIKEQVEAFARDPHVGSNKPKLIKHEHEAYNSWQKSPVHTTKFCVPYMITEGPEGGKVFWGQKPSAPTERRENKVQLQPLFPGKKEEFDRIKAIHELVETKGLDVISPRRALELVLLYTQNHDFGGKECSRHSRFLKALNMPDKELAETVSKCIREDFCIFVSENNYTRIEIDDYDYKGEAEQLALTFGIADHDITKKMQEMLDGND